MASPLSHIRRAFSDKKIPTITIRSSSVTMTGTEKSGASVTTNDSLLTSTHPNPATLPLPPSHTSTPTSTTSTPHRILTARSVRGTGLLGYDFSPRKKWWMLTVTFLVQVSMNWNAAIFANAVPGLAAHLDVPRARIRLGQMAFLVAYAFGCEAWAPWSEELGRKWIMQASLALVNVWQLPCALAGSTGTVIVARALGGLSSAGGSVTLGLVADLYGPAEQQYALAYVVLSSCAGSAIAPIFGGIIETYLGYRWVFWISLILGGITQFVHFWTPETNPDVILDREAKRRRATGEDPDIYGPLESRGSYLKRLDMRHVLSLMWRPYKFLLTEPIVAALSLLSGFSDALIFTGLDSFGLVLSRWNFSIVQVGLAFIPLVLGYVIGYLSFLPVYRIDRRKMNGNPFNITAEHRLWWLLWLVPLEPIGLFGYAWTSWGPPVHWIWPLFFSCLIGIANLAIYMATIDYMVAAYGPYSASATGGNGFCRDFLAGIAALYATPFYRNIKPGTHWQTIIPTLTLSIIGVLLCIPVYLIYWKGEWLRTRSPYARELELTRQREQLEHPETIIVQRPEIEA